MVGVSNGTNLLCMTDSSMSRNADVADEIISKDAHFEIRESLKKNVMQNSKIELTIKIDSLVWRNLIKN